MTESDLRQTTDWGTFRTARIRKTTSNMTSNYEAKFSNNYLFNLAKNIYAVNVELEHQ